MGFFSKKKQYEIAPESELAPLSSNSLSALKDISKDSFFNVSQSVGALEIDDEQKMWRSISFNRHVAFRFSEIESIEREKETVYSTLGTSTGKYSGSSVGITTNGLSGGASSGNIVQRTSALTTASHVYVVSVYTKIPKYRNVTIEASSPAEAQAIIKELEARKSKDTTDPGTSQITQSAAEDMKPSPSQIQSTADEIRKYKELLDDGIITAEEFALKKKQLLET